MQWIPGKVSSNRDDFPACGEKVLGLYSSGFWEEIMYSMGAGWYAPKTGAARHPPTWWARVDSRPPKVSEVGEGGPVGEEGPLGPDASVMERVRKFLEKLIEVRDYYAQTPEVPLPEIGRYGCYDDWAADEAAKVLKVISLRPAPATASTQGEAGPKGTDGPLETFACGLEETLQAASTPPSQPPLALDVSLEKARALHRVWRALNDGDCPNCHKYHAATEILRSQENITCPSCWFHVKKTEIAAIEKMFAPAMNAAVAIFNQWRDENNNKQENMDAVG